MGKPKEWWADPTNAESWIKQSDKYDAGGDPSIGIVMDEIGDKFNSVLEVGAGTGRLIGALSNKFTKVDCYSMDISLELAKYVSEKYPHVQIVCSEITNIPFYSKSIDLVYTYQVLQHVEPDEIYRALKELCRVAKKEVWLWESIGRNKYSCGSRACACHDGSWIWNIDKMVECYEVKSCGFKTLRLYKIKV